MLASLKRHTALLLLLVMFVPIIAACGGAATTTTDTPVAEEEEPAAEEEPTEEPATEEEEPAAEEEPTEEPATEEEEPAAEEEPTEEPATEEEEPADAPSAGEAVALPEVDPAAVEGNITTAGSSTVFPLAERIADEFTDEGYSSQITIDSIGSGAGFERFCVAAETDIANASRPIKEEEVAECQENGRDPIEFRVGTDGLAIVINSENDFLEDVTLEELAQIWSTAETWADVNAEWPAEPILRFAPGTDSGTFDFFVEEVFDEEKDPLLNASNLQMSEDDNVLVQGVEGSPYAIGFFGYAYYEQEQDRMQIVAVEGVEPQASTVETGEYALARPLFMYSTAEIMQEKPQVADFLNYVLTNVNSVISDVGYFAASDESLNAARQEWLDATQ